jgi:hypothetical protein
LLIHPVHRYTVLTWLCIYLAPVQPFIEQYCSTTICSDGHWSLTLPYTHYHPDGESRPEVGTDRPRSWRRPDVRPVPRPAFSTETLPIPVAVHFMARRAKDKTPFVFALKADTPSPRHNSSMACIQKCAFYHT